MEKAVKNKGGRPRKAADHVRKTLNLFVTADQENWLNKVKSESGKSWGEILESIIEGRLGDA